MNAHKYWQYRRLTYEPESTCQVVPGGERERDNKRKQFSCQIEAQRISPNFVSFADMIEIFLFFYV